MSTEAIEVLRKIEALATYFEDTKYKKIIEASRRAVRENKFTSAEIILRTLPTDEQLLEQLIEKLKGKSVASTLERIQKGERGYTAMKGLSSLLTHILIECEKGATEFRKLVPVILERLNTEGYRIIKERKRPEMSNENTQFDFQRLLKNTRTVSEEMAEPDDVRKEDQIPEEEVGGPERRTAGLPSDAEIATLVTDAISVSKGDVSATIVEIMNSLIREFGLTQEQIREITPKIGLASKIHTSLQQPGQRGDKPRGDSHRPPVAQKESRKK